MTPVPFDPQSHCTLFEVIHFNDEQRRERWAQIGQWMQAGEMPADLPPWVSRSPLIDVSDDDDDDDSAGTRIGIHVIHHNEAQRKERWAVAVAWMQAGTVPVDLPDWAQVRINGMLLNHGGGGGP